MLVHSGVRKSHVNVSLRKPFRLHRRTYTLYRRMRTDTCFFDCMCFLHRGRSLDPGVVKFAQVVGVFPGPRFDDAEGGEGAEADVELLGWEARCSSCSLNTRELGASSAGCQESAETLSFRVDKVCLAGLWHSAILLRCCSLLSRLACGANEDDTERNDTHRHQRLAAAASDDSDDDDDHEHYSHHSSSGSLKSIAAASTTTTAVSIITDHPFCV